MGSHAARRLQSFDYRGFHCYSVTCCTFQRHAWFTAANVVDMATCQLLRSADDTAFAVDAYCWMPDHAHLLLEAMSSVSDFCRLMNTWKQATGYAHMRTTGRRLWQTGYYDHILRADEDRLRVIEYLIANPVRAGLVTEVGNYPFWGSGVWSREQLIEAIQERGREMGREG